MPPSPDSPQQGAGSERANFMSIPPEIRLHIFYLCFSDKGPRILLRKPDASDHPPSWDRPVLLCQISRDTDLLRTNKKFHEEAAYVFYRYHTFQMRLGTVYDWTPFKTTFYFSKMKHLSLHTPLIWEEKIGQTEADAKIESHLGVVQNQCTSLRTLTFYVLSIQMPGNFLYEPLLKGRTSELLKTISLRLDRLSILKFGTDNPLSSFRRGIAQETQWEHEEYYGWPQLIISEIEKQNTLCHHAPECFLLPGRWAVHGWHLYKKGAEHDFPRGLDRSNRP